MSNLAVDGCVLVPVAPATGVITVVSTASSDITVNGKGVFFKEIKFTVSASNGGGAVTNNDGTGEGSIIASGSSILDANGDIAVLEGDVSDSVEIHGTAGIVEASGTIVVKVESAGQTDAMQLDD